MKANRNLLLDLGRQPRCFDFQKNKSEDIPLFDLKLKQSKSSGLISIENPIPPQNLMPTFDWIVNKEPDEHSNIIAEESIKHLKSNDGKILFLTNFDYKSYSIAHEKIGSRANLLKLNKNNSDYINQATIEQKILNAFKKDLKSHLNKYEVLVCSRLLEHSNDLSKLLECISQFLNFDGKIIVEIPDSTKPLLQGDVGMIWEEHINYFTPESLKLEFNENGFSNYSCSTISYPQEDALIGVFSKQNLENVISTRLPIGEYEIANVFKRKIINIKAKIKGFLSNFKGTGKKIAFFGAGHRAVMFINVLKIKDYVDFVVDDDPHKSKLYLPLSNLEIKKTNDVDWNEVGLCISAVSLPIEEKIRLKLFKLTKNELLFFSMSPDSDFLLPIFKEI